MIRNTSHSSKNYQKCLQEGIAQTRKLSTSAHGSDSSRNATTCLSVSVCVCVPVCPCTRSCGQCVTHSDTTLSHSRASNTEHIFGPHTLSKNHRIHTFCSSVEFLNADEDTDAASETSSLLYMKHAQALITSCHADTCVWKMWERHERT